MEKIEEVKELSLAQLKKMALNDEFNDPRVVVMILRLDRAVREGKIKLK